MATLVPYFVSPTEISYVNVDRYHAILVDLENGDVTFHLKNGDIAATAHRDLMTTEQWNRLLYDLRLLRPTEAFRSPAVRSTCI